MDRLIEKKKWPPRKIIFYSLTAAFVLVVIYSLIFADNQSKLNVETAKITISIVQSGPFNEYIPVTGSIVPLKTVYLDAIEGGRIEKKFMEAGSIVNEGDKILQISNTNLMMDIMFRESEIFEHSNNLRNTRLAMEQNQLNLRAQLIDLNYQIKQLHRDYDRNKALLENNLVSQLDFERISDQYEYAQKKRELAIESFRQDSIFRKVQIRQLEESLRRMQNNLVLVKSKLENLTIKAPVSGQLTALNAEIGESKSVGERLGQIDILEGFKVRTPVDEYYLHRIQKGLHGEFDFAGATYELTVDKIFPEIRNGRFDVDLVFSASEPEGIRRGQTLHIRLELGNLNQAVLLARGGFYQKTGGQWVYVLDKSNKFAYKRQIRLGMQNPQMFEVLEGLEPGERVITSSYENFGENDILVLSE